MDGLLIDSERAIIDAWICAADEYAIPLSKRTMLSLVGISQIESDVLLIKELGNNEFIKVSARASEILSQTVFVLKPGVKDILSLLHRAGVPCAVASSSSSYDIQKRLSDVGIFNFFKAHVGRDEVLKGKPDPDVYRLAADRMEVLPENCLAFEDSHNGTLSALSSGAQVVVVPDLIQPIKPLADRCTKIFTSMTEAIEHVPDWFLVQVLK